MIFINFFLNKCYGYTLRSRLFLNSNLNKKEITYCFKTCINKLYTLRLPFQCLSIKDPAVQEGMECPSTSLLEHFQGA